MLSAREQKLLSILYFLLILFAIYIYAIVYLHPLLRSWLNQRMEKNTLTTEINEYRNETTLFRSLQKRYTAIAGRYLHKSNQYQFLEVIKEINKKTAVKMNKITFDIRKGEPADFAGILVEFTADTTQIYNWLRAVETADLNFQIENYTLAFDSGKSRATVSLVIYLIN